MPNDERKYVDLLFRTTRKYANWDPEIEMKVGDWGRISSGKRWWEFWRAPKGTFIKEGNIYADEMADKYGIPHPKEYGAEATDGVSSYVSKNGRKCDFEVAAEGQTPIFAQCGFKTGYTFSSGAGATLFMYEDTITTLEYPGTLRRLLQNEKFKKSKKHVIVSEVHRCSSYARLLTSENETNVAFGLSIEPPVSGVMSGSGDITWQRSSDTGNFKWKSNKNGDRTFYPLFRLVSLTHGPVSDGLRADSDGGDPPLPDAVPPWMEDADETDSGSVQQADH